MIHIIEDGTSAFNLPAGMCLVARPGSTGAVASLSLESGDVTFAPQTASGIGNFVVAGPFAKPCRLKLSASGEVAVEMTSGDGARTLVQTGIPFVFQSSGSVDDSGGFGGVLSGLTALPVAYGWSYCYFPAGKLIAGSAAGWWLTNLTSTTGGIVYNHQYAGGQPSIPSNPARFPTGSPGAYTQTSGSTDIPAITCVIPAGAMGPNGAIEWDQKRAAVNSANNKQFNLLFGGQLVCGNTLTTSALLQGAVGTIHNRGSELAQVSVQSSYGDANSGSMRRQTVDTTQSQLFVHAMYIANASDYAVLEGASVILRPKF